MNYEIVELKDYSGDKTTIYSVILNDEEETLYDVFIDENIDKYEDEVRDIDQRLEIIASEHGARVQYFKTKEGKPGDGVCALYDEPDKHLRLYCIRYDNCTIILGGGGPKNVRAWQDDEKLTEQVEIMIKVSNDIFKRIEEGEIEWSRDGRYLLGDLKFKDDGKE